MNRPFESIEEMNEALIENWNELVSRGDRIYHLGDFSFGTKGQNAALRYESNYRIRVAG